MKTAVQQIAETKQLSEEALWEAIEAAFAAAYKREYGKSDQVIRARINRDTGETNFFQAKQVLGEEQVLPEEETSDSENETRVRFNPERHMMVEDAQLVRQGVKPDEEILFPLEAKSDFGRIATQSARQAVTQRIHEAEREAAIAEFEGKEGNLVHGQVQRVERGNVFIDLGRTIAILPYAEQIRGERFKQGDTIHAFVVAIDTTRRSGGFVRLSRANAQFVVKLFEAEVPELSEGVLEVKKIARDPGVRTKIAVESKDTTVDPVGALIGQRGVRVMAVKSELGGEQIDIINWSDALDAFIGEALLPAEVGEVAINEKTQKAEVKTGEDQIPIAIGRGGQNLSLAARLTEHAIVILETGGEEVAEATREGEVTILKQQEDEAEMSRKVEKGEEQEKVAGGNEKKEGEKEKDAEEQEEKKETESEETTEIETDEKKTEE